MVNYSSVWHLDPAFNSLRIYCMMQLQHMCPGFVVELMNTLKEGQK